MDTAGRIAAEAKEEGERGKVKKKPNTDKPFFRSHLRPCKRLLILLKSLSGAPTSGKRRASRRKEGKKKKRKNGLRRHIDFLAAGPAGRADTRRGRHTAALATGDVLATGDIRLAAVREDSRPAAVRDNRLAGRTFATPRSNLKLVNFKIPVTDNTLIPPPQQSSAAQ